MKLKERTLLIFGLAFMTIPILARTIHCPAFSRYYQDADQVVLAKAKLSQGKEGYEIQKYYKGRETSIPQTFCSCQDVCCIGSYYHEQYYYILFVDKDSLSRSYRIGLNVDTTMWRSFFYELDEIYRIQNLETRHQNYAKWLLQYFQKEEFRRIVIEELREGNGFLFPSRALCRDTMHLVSGDHDECQLPSLFSKTQQHFLLQLLNKKQLFLETGMFMRHLDLISKSAWQNFFYSNMKIFFEKFDKATTEEDFKQTLKEWDDFFGYYEDIATSEELQSLLFAFTNTPTNLFVNQDYLKTESNMIAKLKQYIWANRSMFTDGNE